MSCRRVRRELLERLRFGELDGRSAPHLDHLRDCVACRDDVGIDRAVVRNLRRALAQRVADAAPSPTAFEAIRRRALEPPAPTWGDRLWRWARVVPAGAAIALLGFALVGNVPSAGVAQGTAPRSVTWPGFQERAPFDPAPRRAFWTEGYLLPSAPATGLIAYVDRSQLPSRPQVGPANQGITR